LALKVLATDMTTPPVKKRVLALGVLQVEIEAITWWDLRDPAFIPSAGLCGEDMTPKEAFFTLKSLRQSTLG